MKKFYNEIKFVPSTPKTYEVRYVENKPSVLSSAARAKVVNRSGSNYLSERTAINNPGYGPGFWEGVEEIVDNIKYTFTQGIKDKKEEIVATALAISYATPAAVVTVPATVAVGAAGGAAWFAGKNVTNSERDVEAGKSLMKMAGGAIAENGQDFQKELERRK